MPAAGVGAPAGEVEEARRSRARASSASRRRRTRSRPTGDLRADAVRLQRERDGGARDADVARRERQDPGEIERRDDQERCRDERLVDSERGCDRGRPRAMRSPIASPTQPAICAAARGQRPRTRKTSSAWANVAAGTRDACAPGDAARDEHAEQQRARSASAAARRSPSRARARARARARGRRRARSRSRRPSRAGPRSGATRDKEREADCGPDPGRRERVHERAGAVARGRHRAASSTRRSASAPTASRHAEVTQRAGERRCGEPEPDRPRRPRALRIPARDAVTEQLRSQRRARRALRSSPGTGQRDAFLSERSRCI